MNAPDTPNNPPPRPGPADADGTPFALRWCPGRAGVARVYRGRVKLFDVAADRLHAIAAMGGPVQVRHADGRGLVTAAAAAYAADRFTALVVSSATGVTSLLGALGLTTVMVWSGDRDAARDHPAFRVLRYAPSGDPAALAEAVGLVFDPRWYVDRRRPDRLARLEARFGLAPGWDGRPCAGRALLTRCWYADDQLGRARADDFFGRKYDRAVRNGRSPAAATRLVGRYFVKSFFAAWVDGYAPTPRGDRMFDPAALFDATALAAVARKYGSA